MRWAALCAGLGGENPSLASWIHVPTGMLLSAGPWQEKMKKAEKEGKKEARQFSALSHHF